MSVLEAVEQDLEKLGLSASGSTLAETAKALARELDAENSATSKSMCAKSMVEVLREIRVLSPPTREKDDLEDLRAERADRLARRATAAHSSSS